MNVVNKYCNIVNMGKISKDKAKQLAKKYKINTSIVPITDFHYALNVENGDVRIVVNNLLKYPDYYERHRVEFLGDEEDGIDDYQYKYDNLEEKGLLYDGDTIVANVLINHLDDETALLDQVFIFDSYRGQKLCTDMVTRTINSWMKHQKKKPKNFLINMHTYYPVKAYSCYNTAMERNGYELVQSIKNSVPYDEETGEDIEMDEFDPQKHDLWEEELVFMRVDDKDDEDGYDEFGFDQEQLDKEWKNVKKWSDIQDRYIRFLKGQISGTPTHFSPLTEDVIESNGIKDLIKMVQSGFVTVDSQPGICNSFTNPKNLRTGQEEQRQYVIGTMQNKDINPFIEKLIQYDVYIRVCNSKNKCCFTNFEGSLNLTKDRFDGEEWNYPTNIPDECYFENPLGMYKDKPSFDKLNKWIKKNTSTVLIVAKEYCEVNVFNKWIIDALRSEDEEDGDPTKVWETYKEKLIEKLKNDDRRFDMVTVEDSHELPEQFMDADPSRNKKYLEWIVKSYIEGGIKRFEDLSRTKVALLKYEYLLRKKLVKGKWGKDINGFCGIAGCTLEKRGKNKKEKPGLEAFLDNYKEDLKSYEDEQEIKLNEGEATLLFEDNSIKIIVPETEAAACKYGRGTRWCTAATKGQNMFDYYKQDGDLYIIIPKNPEHQGEKYQLHFESEQYMNENDESVTIAYLVKRFPQIIKPLTGEILSSLIREYNGMPHDENLIKEILDKIPNSKNLYGSRYDDDLERSVATPIIMLALENGTEWIVDELLKRGADINEVDDEGRNAFAMELGNDDYLLENGADIDSRVDNMGNTRLIKSSGIGDVKDVRYLLSKGADPNIVGDHERNALMWTIKDSVDEKFSIEIAKMLIDAGTDLTHYDYDGRTALDLAKRERLTEVVKLIEDKLGIKESDEEDGLSPERIWKEYGEKVKEKLEKDDETILYLYDDDELPKEFIEADPSPNKKYLEWIVKSYVEDGIKKYEDLGRVKQALLKYQYLITKKVVKTFGKDINDFCGIAGCTTGKKKKEKLGLENFLEQSEFVEPLEKFNKQEDIKLKEGEATLLYEDDEIKVIIPRTEAAACKYGHETRWCTASTKGQNMFDYYNKQGPLYIVIPKNPRRKGEKYQLHLESDSYMDEKDDDVEIDTLLDRFPSLEKVPELSRVLLTEKLKRVIQNNPKYEQVKQLLEAGAYPDASVEDTSPVNVGADEIQIPLFTYALTWGGKDKLRIGQLFLDHGVNVDIKTDIEETALMYASCHGENELVKWLLERGADVNSSEIMYYWSILDVAAINGHIDTMKILIASGAKVDTDPLNNVLEYGQGDFAFDVAKLLLENGVDKDDLIDVAEKHGDEELVEKIESLQVQNTLSKAFNVADLTKFDNLRL